MEKKKVLYAILLALLFFPIVGFAQKRTETEALNIAQDFLAQHSKYSSKLNSVPLSQIVKRAKQQAVSVPELESRQSGDGFYIISDNKTKSFVLVSGDERMKSVLGYSLTSSFEGESIAPGLLDLMNGYQRVFDKLQSLNPDATISTAAATRSVSAIEPLIQTKWDQTSPYKDLCPERKDLTDGTKCATGCVATAMAQVMNYHQYPAAGTGYIIYSTNWGTYLCEDLSDITFDWSNMSNTYDDNSSDAQKEAVANLMKACGYSVYMDYGESSGASPYNIAYALINNFGYNKNLNLKMADYYSSTEWIEMIDEELENKRPILYAGYDPNEGGHSFILDGRDETGLYHFNFGWGTLGYLFGDGYYAVDAISVTFYGVNFTEDHNMIIGIVPQTQGIHEEVFYANSFSFYQLEIDTKSKSNTSYTSFLPYCYSSKSQTSSTTNQAKFNGEIGIGLFDKNFNFIDSLSSKRVENLLSCDCDYSYFLKKIVFSSETFTENSQYYIAPYAKADDSDDVTRIRTLGGNEDWYLAKTENGVVTLTLKGVMGEETPTVQTLKTGYYNAVAYDETQGKKDWQITLWQDESDQTKYWIGNIDPIVASKGYTYESGWNKVYGYLNNTGTRLIIPANQTIGEGIVLKNQGDDDDITLIVASDQNTMSIASAWGSYQDDNSGDTREETLLSKYTDATFAYTTEKEGDVAKPQITQNGASVKITTATENANIYYTTDGTEPTIKSQKYTAEITLNCNGTVKAIAEKNGELSEVAQLTVNSFTVSDPVISTANGKVQITCATTGAAIYYTTDGTEPTTTSALYKEPLTFTLTTVVKAIAAKENFNNSSVVSYTYTVVNPEPSGVSMTVSDNVAGSLSVRIAESDRLNVEDLTISGNLNGDDIKLIREMLQNGKLSRLNLTNANIVAGGGAYYSSYTTENGVIGSFMFCYFDNLVSLKLPNSATLVEMSAVSNNKNLIELVLPNDCSKMESLSISYNKQLTKLSLPSKVSTFTASCVSGCAALEEIEIEANNSSFCMVDGVLFSIDKKKIVWYSPCKKDASYTVPTSVTTIGEYCFTKSCLHTVVLNEGLQEIESSAFEYSKELSSVNFPSSLTTIGIMAFENCNLSSISLSSVSKIDLLSFAYNPNLTRVSFGKQVSDIDDTAFNGCKQLKAFDVDEDNPYYSAEDGILFNKEHTILYKYPVAKSNTSYSIPEEVINVGDNAFNGCLNLENVNIGVSVEEIGASAFSDSRCKYIKMTSNSNVSKIGMLAFSDCDSLRSLIIPNAVNEIPLLCAAYCDKLEYIKLPNDITTINMSAFNRCKNLNTIESYIEAIGGVEVEDNAFTAISDTCLWIVPKGTAAKYKACSWWVSTWRISENLTTGIHEVTNSPHSDITIGNGCLLVTKEKDGVINVYNIAGCLYAKTTCKAGVPVRISLPAGIYIVDGRKVIVGK